MLVYQDAWNTLEEVDGGLYELKHDNGVHRFVRIVPCNARVLVERVNGVPNIVFFAVGTTTVAFAPLASATGVDEIRALFIRNA